MNRVISKYLFYYPSTFLMGEFVYAEYKRSLKFQNFSRSQIIEYQTAKISHVIKYAYQNFSFYRDLYKSHGVTPDDFCYIDDLAKFPILRKDDLSRLRDCLPNSFRNIFSVTKTTGGSLGAPVTIIKGHSGLAKERAATLLGYSWAGVQLGDPHARLWGEPIETKKKLVASLKDLVSNRLRLSAFSMNEKTLNLYIKKMHVFKPRYIYGYVSAILELIRFIDEKKKSLPSSLVAIITTSEVLRSEDRGYIENITGIRVYNEYGCGEVGSIAHDCENQNLHLMEQNHYVEESGNYGSESALITDFNNKLMPLIRYEIGDVITFSDEVCSCGKELRLVEQIHGRTYDFLETPSGDKVHPEKVLYIFEKLKSLGHDIPRFQVVQTSIETLEIRLKCSSGQAYLKTLVLNEFNRYFSGDFRSQVVFVKSLFRERSGKIRLIKRGF